MWIRSVTDGRGNTFLDGCLGSRTDKAYRSEHDIQRFKSDMRSDRSEKRRHGSMTNFELRIKGCKENGTEVFELEPGLYKTQNEYCDGRNFYRTSPVYHVWDVDTRIYCGMSLKTAYEAVRKC